MPGLRRYEIVGRTFFVTSVTFNRLPVLEGNEKMLLDTFHNITNRYSYDLIAWVIMPNHFHLILHTDNVSLSLILQRIKSSFSLTYNSVNNRKNRSIW